MTLTKSIKPIIVSLALLSSSVASAKLASFLPDMPESTNSDYNYVGVRTGVVFPGNTQGNSDLQSVSPDTSYTVGFSVGRKIKDRFAIEVEYMHRGESDIKSSSSTTGVRDTWGVKANTLMLNASADIVTDSSVRPYVKFGIGASRNEANRYVSVDALQETQTWESKSSTKLAWQAALGANMSVTKSIDANMEYAYVDRGEFRTKSGSSTVGGINYTSSNEPDKIGKLREQVVTIGAKYKF